MEKKSGILTWRRLAFSLLTAFSLSTTTAPAQVIYAISGTNLIRFNAATPSTIISTVAVTGIAPNQSISGMDFRPTSGELFIIGYNNSSGEARLYILNRTTGVATAVGPAPSPLTTNMQPLGFDFNPTVDRIRVTGSNGSNYRFDPNTGGLAATDTPLDYAVGDPFAGINPYIGAVAYTNSYIGAGLTTLYDYDYVLNNLVVQNPANAGTLNTIGFSGIGVNSADPSMGMDIFKNPLTGTETAYLSANTGTSLNDNLYTVNLNSGQCVLVGAIGAGLPVTDISVFIDRTMPPLIGFLMYGITNTNTLISFDSNNPTFIRSYIPITGLSAGDLLVAIDSRPASGELYALVYNLTSTVSALVTLNPTTGVATFIGNPLLLSITNGEVGFDFIPAVDRIRLTAAGTNVNYRLNPVTGAITATDGLLTYAPGDLFQGTDPNIGASAYTSNYAGAPVSVLYNYDDSLNTLTTQDPPNAGALHTIGPSGIILSPSNRTAGMDIVYNYANATDHAYLCANTNSTYDNFYTLNLLSGTATLVGTIGLGIPVFDISGKIDTIPLSVFEPMPGFRISMFPNPVSDVLFFMNNLSDPFRVELFDITGKQINYRNFDSSIPGEFSLNLSSLAPGLYVVSIKTTWASWHGTFVKE